MKKVKIASLVSAVGLAAVISCALLHVGMAQAQPFAWKDEKGKMVYGDNPPSNAKELRDLSRPVESEEELPDLPIRRLNETAVDKKRMMPADKSGDAASAAKPMPVPMPSSPNVKQ